MGLLQTSVAKQRAEESVPQPAHKPRQLSDTQVALLLIAPAVALLLTIILYPLVNSMYIGLLDKSLIYGGDVAPVIH